MKVLIWIMCLFGSAVVNSLIKAADIPYTLAELLTTNHNTDTIALLTGTITGIFTAATWGFAYFLALRLCKRWDKNSITKRAKKAGLTDFQYARSTADPTIISYCESHLHLSPDEISEYIQRQADHGKLKANCAKVLIRVYSQNAGRPAPTEETANSSKSNTLSTNEHQTEEACNSSSATTHAEETVYYMEDANGMTVRVPESKLDAWAEEQERIKNMPETVKLTEREKMLRDRILHDIYGPRSDSK